MKLDDLAELLHLSPYDKNGHFQKELKTVSQSDIEPIRFICPISMSCTTKGCNAAHLSLATRERDIPKVTLIKGSSIFTRVFALTGECAKCHTLYAADHESYVIPDQRRRKVFLNMAPYLKVGTNIWVDRVFSNAVINGVYSFHASTSAYVEYWNQSFGSLYATNGVKLGRKQVWQAFIQESIRTLANAANINFEAHANMDINGLVQQALNVLGNDGVICAAQNHSCSECTKPYKQTVTDAGDSTRSVKMAVLDGIVMGPTVSFEIIL